MRPVEGLALRTIRGTLVETPRRSLDVGWNGSDLRTIAGRWRRPTYRCRCRGEPGGRPPQTQRSQHGARPLRDPGISGAGISPCNRRERFAKRLGVCILISV